MRRLLSMLGDAGFCVEMCIVRSAGNLVPDMSAIDDVLDAFEAKCAAIDAVVRAAGLAIDADDKLAYEAELVTLVALVGDDDSEAVRLRTLAFFMFSPLVDDSPNLHGMNPWPEEASQRGQG